MDPLGNTTTYTYNFSGFMLSPTQIPLDNLNYDYNSTFNDGTNPPLTDSLIGNLSAQLPEPGAIGLVLAGVPVLLRRRRQRGFAG
jgi:hypothetical protein